MPPLVELPDLPECDALTLARAVRRVMEKQAGEVATPSVGPRALMARLPRIDRMERGAEQLFSSIPPASHEDEAAGKYFSAIIESCVMVAAADGLAGEERDAVIELIRLSTGEDMGSDRAGELFDAYAGLLEEQGLETRLDAVAERLDDFLARQEAMGFAALVAIADRELADREFVVLMALAKRLDFSRGEVEAVIRQVAAELADAVKVSANPSPASR
jgi:tellurite resistance protein